MSRRKLLSIQPRGRVISAKGYIGIYRGRTKAVKGRQGKDLCFLLLPPPIPHPNLKSHDLGGAKQGETSVLLFFPMARNSGKVKNLTKHSSSLPHCLPLGPKPFPRPQPCIKLCPRASRSLECALLLSGQAFGSNAKSSSLTCFICSKPAHHSDLPSNVIPWGAPSQAPWTWQLFHKSLPRGL